jgi:transposase
MSSRRQSAELKKLELRKHSRKSYSVEEKIRIILESLKEGSGIDEICQKEGISPVLLNNWIKEFVEGGKSRLNGDIKREGPASEIQSLKSENADLKQLVAELTLELRLLRKSLNGVE